MFTFSLSLLLYHYCTTTSTTVWNVTFWLLLGLTFLFWTKKKIWMHSTHWALMAILAESKYTHKTPPPLWISFLWSFLFRRRLENIIGHFLTTYWSGTNIVEESERCMTSQTKEDKFSHCLTFFLTHTISFTMPKVEKRGVYKGVPSSISWTQKYTMGPLNYCTLLTANV